VDAATGDWEVGIGTYSAGVNTLTRTTVLESSNNGNLVDFAAGTKDVFCTYPAEKSVDSETAQTLTNKTLGSGTAISGGTINGATIGGTTAAAGSFTTLTTSSTVTHNGGTANGVAYLNASKVLTTGSALTFDGSTLTSGTHTIASGNLTFTGTGNRITGDFSNATIANRVMFQSSTTNGATQTGLIPNGTATASSIEFYNGSDPANAQLGQLLQNASEFRISATYRGTPSSGTYLPMTFSTGGSERMRIDTSGNLGLGVTPSAWGSGARVLQFANGGAIGSEINGYLTSTVNAVETSSGNWTYISSGLGAARQRINYGSYQWYTAPSGTAGNAISFSQVMTLDASGNLSIGNTSAQGRVAISGSAGSTGSGDLVLDSDASYAEIQSYNKPLILNRQGNEIRVNGITDQGAYNLQVNGTGVWGAGAYVNGSDSRIKDDITPLASGLDVVQKLNPVTYRYKESWSKDQSVQPGFIAQEMLVALEGTGYVDGVVQQGGAEQYYSVAYQNVIPILTKAIQEQQALIESLAARVAQLEGN
jgi:hypothetical protein